MRGSVLDHLRKAIGLLEADKRNRWLMLIGLAVIVSLLEALAAILVFGLLSLVTLPDQAVALPFFGDLQQMFPDRSHEQLVSYLGISVAAVYSTRSIAYVVQSYAQNRVSHDAGASLAARLLRGYLYMPYVFHLKRNSAELVRNLYGATYEVVTNIFIPFIALASEILLALGIFAVLFAASPAVTLGGVAFMAPLIVLILRLIQPRLRALGEESQQLHRDNLQSIQQSLQGLREIKVMTAEAHFSEGFRTNRQAVARAYARRNVLFDVPRVLIETSVVLGVVLFLGLSVADGGAADRTLALLGLFAYAVLRLMPSLNRIIGSLSTIRFGAAAVEILHEDLQLQLMQQANTDERAAEPQEFASEIRLEDVSFEYEPGRKVLRNVSTTFRKGESIGIVGSTGSGKSTLIDILLGLIEPTTGSITVDGTELSDRSSWQRNMGVVPQTTFLIDDSLRRNVAFGVPDDQVDEGLLSQAISSAQLLEFVAGLPDGLDTLIGERGVRMSGGQRQRLAIARALYRRPQILVFDEATSALDDRTESALMASLDSLKFAGTRIMVAHRLSTVARCDRVLLIQEGRLVDEGTLSDLRGRHPALRTA